MTSPPKWLSATVSSMMRKPFIFLTALLSLAGLRHGAPAGADRKLLALECPLSTGAMSATAQE